MIFADARNYDTAKKLRDGILAINISNILYNLKADPSPIHIDSTSKTGDVAYLFHTSGTSSGLPKPIPQLHHGAVSVLPRLSNGGTHSTFSTTPLYHGGIADCLRAWASGAMIHLFPGTQPITSANIQRSAELANRFLNGAHPAKYFTSVPYILQMLIEESLDQEVSSGLALLQGMDLVGVGGAALPQAVGDELVSKGVKLVSRFGSAECGFLLSSNRDYKSDHEWSWLRADPSLQPEYYDFEPQAQNQNDSSPPLFEFVVKPRWPHRGKTNRPDGSYATADLFERHPIKPNAWRYHSRADAQITMLNGKKFDPAPVEAELLSSAVGKRILEDAMIFGAGREAPGMLLVPRWNIDFINDHQLIDDLWPTIHKMNSEAQSHARISKGLLLVIRSKEEDRSLLPKSSKGTILRRQAEALFSKEIERTYAEEEVAEEESTIHAVPDNEVMDQLTTLFSEVLGRKVNPSRDLFIQGVDSLACSRLRKRISRKFFAESGISIPLNIVYDQGTIERLSRYIVRSRTSDLNTIGSHTGGNDNNEEVSQEQLMLDLVHKYRHPVHSPTGSLDHQNERVVVLTGATGLLGAHILDLLLRDPKVTKVYCLVRASSEEDGKARIQKSLSARYLKSFTVETSQRVISLPCTLSEVTGFGLSEADRRRIASEATMIIHAAWSVNFSLQLHSFKDQLAGLRDLLRLRDATRGAAARLVFISSTAAVSSHAGGERPAQETVSSEPEDSSTLGYSRSKWVAENICASARVGGSFSTPPAYSGEATLDADEKFPVVIIRVGQLCGSRKDGAWNASEAYPIMLSSSRITGCLPDLQDQPLSWLPVDLAAEAVLELAFLGGLERGGRAATHQKTPVYHVVNVHHEPSWADMLEWISQACEDENDAALENQQEPQRPGDGELEIVSPAEWVDILEDALEKEEHPARSLLHLWKEAYAQKYVIDKGYETKTPLAVSRSRPPVFETRITERASTVMRSVMPLGRDDVVRLWDWIQSNVY